jgi:hypothetical protein
MAETERQQRKDSSQDDSDRRRAPRHQAAKLGKLITRVIGGGEVKLLDFSRSGVLIESDTRLTIGQKATIRLTTTDATLTVTGKVVRSRVASVNGAIVYHTAFALDDDLTALEQNVSRPRKDAKKESRASARGSGDETGPSAGADGARGSEHAYSTNLDDAGVGASVDPILEFLATVPHDLAELRRRAAVNNW